MGGAGLGPSAVLTLERRVEAEWLDYPMTRRGKRRARSRNGIPASVVSSRPVKSHQKCIGLVGCVDHEVRCTRGQRSREEQDHTSAWVTQGLEGRVNEGTKGLESVVGRLFVCLFVLPPLSPRGATFRGTRAVLNDRAEAVTFRPLSRPKHKRSDKFLRSRKDDFSSTLA